MCQLSPPSIHNTPIPSKKILHENHIQNKFKVLRRQTSGEATGAGALAVVVANLHVGGSGHWVVLHRPEQQ